MAAKPFRLLIIAALSLLVGAARAQGSGDDADQFEGDPPDRAARLAYLGGDVSLQPAGEDEWAPALLNRPLTTGDKLWTEKGARVEIQVSQSAIRLDGNTGFSFLDLGDDTVQMRVTAGTVIVDVRALEGREQIEIDTPNIALAILRPGSYRVEVNDAGDATTVKIGEGEAEATGPGTNQLIHSEQAVTFRGADELVADWGTLGAPDDFDEWSMERERRGERVASSATAKYVSPDVTGYDDLEEYGSWSSEPEYGYVWTPRHVAIGWSPYRYGRWVWISPWGWTWIDDSPWGYAPFHYGRWAHVRNRWCWVPGPRHVRAVYAPALVGWVGSRGAYVSWVPLGPRDVYVPHRRFSRHYWERVNFANARALERQQVREIWERRREAQDFRNRHAPDSITAVARTAFTGAQRVGDRRVRFNEREMAGHDGNGAGPQLRPVRDSRLGGVVRANPHMSPAIAARQVIVKREPPATSARYARRPTEHRQEWRTQQDARAQADSTRTPPGGFRGDLNRRNDRPSRVERETPHPSPGAHQSPGAPAAQVSPSDSGSLAERVRDVRERQERDRNAGNVQRWQREDRPDRVARPEAGDQAARPDRGSRDDVRESQYPQYSQRPRRTQDAVREAVARQLEQQRERQSHDRPREQRVEQPRAEYRQQERPRMVSPPERREQPHREQPRVERSQPQPQPRAEPPRERSQPAPRAERPAENRSPRGGERHQRH